MRAELDQNRADMEEAKTQAETSEAEVGALTAKLTDAEERASKLSDELMTWTNRIIDRDKKIANLQKDADLNRSKMANELRDLQNQHAHIIEGIHNTYRSSTSWKVSAPLRLIKLWFNGDR